MLTPSPSDTTQNTTIHKDGKSYQPRSSSENQLAVVVRKQITWQQFLKEKAFALYIIH